MWIYIRQQGQQNIMINENYASLSKKKCMIRMMMYFYWQRKFKIYDRRNGLEYSLPNQEGQLSKLCMLAGQGALKKSHINASGIYKDQASQMQK